MSNVNGGDTRPCSQCGASVSLEISGPLPPFLQEIAARVLTGTAPVLCTDCSERQEREEDERDAAERAAAAHEERRRVAGLPPKWRDHSFATLDDDTARADARRTAMAWALGEFKGLVLFGEVGRGKTAMAAAAANAMLQRRSLRWLPVAELLLDLRMPFDAPEYARAVRKLDAARGRAALVLDDLDKLKPTEHAVQPLYIAINAWVEADLPLLVTLNSDLDSLSEWMPDTFGDAIASRLSGYCKVREVGGRDRRVRP